MKQIKPIKREKKHAVNRKTLFAALLGLLIIIAGITYGILRAVDAWWAVNDLVFDKPVACEFNKPVRIVEREASTVELIKIVETIPAPEDLTSEPEKLIYQYFGSEHYRMAIAVSKCEGLNHPADGFNTNTNGSIDVGYMRINSVHFKTEGCSLLEVATPEGNIACGYRVWDRADGVEGNEKGSFDPWVGYWNGCALTKYE